jgi:phosphoenolpyruvate---glycerone phosphotransferase subunit DhaK
MKKFMNDRASMQDESLAGFASAHGSIVRLGAGGRHVVRSKPSSGKVALVSGGGAGHEPMHCGFVGHGMLDAACQGPVFTSPTPDLIAAAAEDVTGPMGVLFIVKNYEGDRLNFDMAADMAQARLAGSVRQLLVDDDVGHATIDAIDESRRGLAGTMIVEKVLGAAAERGMDMDRLLALGRKAVARTRTMGVALSGCTPPMATRPTFDLGAGEMELGVGIHGEPGRRRAAMVDADAIAEELVHAVMASLDPPPNAKVLTLLNGFGGTPLMELHLMHGAILRGLPSRRVDVIRSLTGNFVTCLDMAGCSLTMMVLDDELLDLWDAPVHTAALRWGM